MDLIFAGTFQLVATFHLPSPALPLCLLDASLTEAKQLASLPDSALSSLPFNQIRSLEYLGHDYIIVLLVCLFVGGTHFEKFGLAVTLVFAFICAELKVTLTLSLIGKISLSSRFPQYLITAMLTGAVQVTTHDSSPAILSW